MAIENAIDPAMPHPQVGACAGDRGARDLSLLERDSRQIDVTLTVV